MYGLDKTKDLADQIQADTEGLQVDDRLGASNIAAPTDEGLADYNKGTEFGLPHKNFGVIESKQDKSDTENPKK